MYIGILFASFLQIWGHDLNHMFQNNFFITSFLMRRLNSDNSFSLKRLLIVSNWGIGGLA